MRNSSLIRCLPWVLAGLLMVSCTREEHGHDEHGRDPHAAEEGPSKDGHDETVIATAVAEEVGIRVAPAGEGVIRDAHEVQGLLTPVEGRHARIRARFPGPVLSVSVGVGDRVRAGATLAVVESNVSMANYNVTAPFAGVILARNVGVGDQAGEAPLFELADLSSLWVDLHLFGADAQHITPNLPVEVVRIADGAIARTRLDRILPGTATASQSTVARATIRNEDGLWRPGTAVRARVTVSERRAALVVPLSAIQSLEGEQVVFVKSGETYAARPVKLGERDSEHAEVLQGVAAGDEVVVEQSYLVKSDIEKASAAHEH
jgi:cobalt-zinc-cadmium efflux system membrane fusion protein